jgi:hypothetical protein
MTVSINDTQHNSIKCRYSVIMLNVVIKSVVVPSQGVKASTATVAAAGIL